MQLTVKEKQVYEKLFIVNNHAMLVADKAELIAESQYKLLDVCDYLVFDKPFIGVALILNVYKIKEIFVLERANSAAGLLQLRQGLYEIIWHCTYFCVQIAAQIGLQRLYAPKRRSAMGEIEQSAR